MISNKEVPKILIIDHCSLNTERQRPACPECRQDACVTSPGRAALNKEVPKILIIDHCSLIIERRRRAAGFTLVEMLVALSILIILMAAVGEIFSLAGRTVRVGQATLAAMSSIRAVESQIARDIHHLDTNGFLVIRQREYAPYWQTGVQYEPGDEVQYITGGGSQFFLCQQANITQAGVTGVPSIPTTAGGGTVDWKTLTGAAGQYPIWRADQISFIETGNFHSRTGSIFDSSTGTLGPETTAAYLTANKALVWFGQFSASYGPVGYNFPNPTAYSAPLSAAQYTDVEHPCWPQNSWVPLGTPPSGQTSGQFYFGRQAMLLIPAGLSAGAGTFGSTIYNDPFYFLSYLSASRDFSTSQPGGSAGYPYNIGTNSNGGPAGANPESEFSTVTSSRLDATMDALPGASFTLKTPPPSNQTLAAPAGLGTIEGYANSLPLDPTLYTSLYDIANFFCYRYSTLTTPSASELGYAGKTPPTSATAVLQQMLNGYYRMTPIMLQGVPSFAVDWTDGAVTVPAGTPPSAPPQLVWYGLDGTPYGTVTNPTTDDAYLPYYSGAAGTKFLPNPEAVYGNSESPSGALDGFTYVFYAGNKPAWPKALKITYAVTDPNNRLQGGRFVTQVVELPQ